MPVRAISSRRSRGTQASGGVGRGDVVWRRRLNDAQIMRLRKLLDNSGFFGLKPAATTQSPDTYAYELSARVGAKHNAVEMFTGTIPASLQPLIEQLEKLLPQDE
jgi:hypothetical protein